MDIDKEIKKLKELFETATKNANIETLKKANKYLKDMTDLMNKYAKGEVDLDEYLKEVKRLGGDTDE